MKRGVLGSSDWADWARLKLGVEMLKHVLCKTRLDTFGAEEDRRNGVRDHRDNVRIPWHAK